jgi:hypothetical protein
VSGLPQNRIFIHRKSCDSPLSLADERVFVQPAPVNGRNFTPDGVTVDQCGNVYAADLALAGGPATLDPGLRGSKMWNSRGEEVLRFEPPEGAINLTLVPNSGKMDSGTSGVRVIRV